MESPCSQAELTPQALDKLERMSLWSCAFQHLFAASRRPDTPQVATRPLSFVETCLALSAVSRAKDYRQNAVPVLLRECLAQLLAAGYQPSERRRREFFDRMVAEAALPVRTKVNAAEVTEEPQLDDKAESFLREYGHRQYGGDPREPWRQPSLEYLAEHPSPELAFSRPAEISYNGRVYTVRKEILLHCPMAPLAKSIDPTNWWKLGPFFETTEPDKRHKGLRGSWDGALHEVFKIDWNGWAMERFDVRLRIDYTATDDLVRADYSLLHDEDGQLLCDDGLVEIRKIPGYSDWCRYTSTKSLKFAADFLNVLAPGVLLMELERSGVGIEGIAREVVRADHQGTPRRGKASSTRRTPNRTRRSSSRRARR